MSITNSATWLALQFYDQIKSLSDVYVGGIWLKSRKTAAWWSSACSMKKLLCQKEGVKLLQIEAFEGCLWEILQLKTTEEC